MPPRVGESDGCDVSRANTVLETDLAVVIHALNHSAVEADKAIQGLCRTRWITDAQIENLRENWQDMITALQVAHIRLTNEREAQ